jgi:hypothetical protein
MYPQRSGPPYGLILIVLLLFGGAYIYLNPMQPQSTGRGPFTSGQGGGLVSEGAQATQVVATGVPERPLDPFIIPSATLFSKDTWIVTEGVYIANIPTAAAMQREIPASWYTAGQRIPLGQVVKGATADAHIVPGLQLYDDTSGQYLVEFEADQANRVLTVRFLKPVAIFSARAFNVRYSQTDKSFLASFVDDTDVLNYLSQMVDQRVRELACSDRDPDTGFFLTDSQGRTVLQAGRADIEDTVRGILGAFYQGQPNSPTVNVIIPDGQCYLRPDPRAEGAPGGQNP